MGLHFMAQHINSTEEMGMVTFSTTSLTDKTTSASSLSIDEVGVANLPSTSTNQSDKGMEMATCLSGNSL